MAGTSGIAQGGSSVASHAFAGLSSKFWSSVFESEDADWTGVPVELRAPLLDQRLLRFPPASAAGALVHWEKTLLREAMRGMLPEVVRARRKSPWNFKRTHVLVH